MNFEITSSSCIYSLFFSFMCTVGCSNTSYKKTASNDNCTKCPMNTVSTTNRTSCVCKVGYYKSSSDSAEVSPCYGKSDLCIFLEFRFKSKLQQIRIKILPYLF